MSGYGAIHASSGSNSVIEDHESDSSGGLRTFPKPKRDSKIGVYTNVKRMIKGKAENEWKDSLRGSQPESPTTDGGSGRRSRSATRKPPVPRSRSSGRNSRNLNRASSATDLTAAAAASASSPDPGKLPSKDPNSAAFRSRRSRRHTVDNNADDQPVLIGKAPSDSGASSPTGGRSNPVIDDLRDKIDFLETLVQDKNAKIERLQRQLDSVEEQQEAKWTSDLEREAKLKRDFAAQMEEAHGKLKDMTESNQILQAKVTSLTKELDEKEARSNDKYQKRERQLLLRIRELERKLQKVDELLRGATSDNTEQEPVSPVPSIPSPLPPPPPVHAPPPSAPAASLSPRRPVSPPSERNHDKKPVTPTNNAKKKMELDKRQKERESERSKRDILQEKRNLRQMKKEQQKEREKERNGVGTSDVSLSMTSDDHNHNNDTQSLDHSDENLEEY